MRTLLERMDPYLDSQMAQALDDVVVYPALCCAAQQACDDGAVTYREWCAIRTAIAGDRETTTRYTFKCATFNGTFDERISQWLVWAEKLLAGIDKRLESVL